MALVDGCPLACRAAAARRAWYRMALVDGCPLACRAAAALLTVGAVTSGLLWPAPPAFVPLPSARSSGSPPRVTASGVRAAAGEGPGHLGRGAFAGVAALLVAGQASKLARRHRVQRRAAAVTGFVKLLCMAGKATPAPPIGPALGSVGANIAMFCKEYNALTADKKGLIPVEVTVFSDKSMKLVLKTPPTSFLCLEAAGVEKGTDNAAENIVGSITLEQLKGIAEIKLPDLNVEDMTRAMKICAVTVDGYEEFCAANPQLDRFGKPMTEEFRHSKASILDRRGPAAVPPEAPEGFDASPVFPELA